MKVAAIIAAGLLCVAGASAQAINDAQIAHIVVTANQVDIDAGKLAASMAVNAEVKKFGQQMVTDHTGVTASTVLILPVSLLVDRPWTLAQPDARAWSALLGLALVSTALAYVVYFRILATAGATNLLLVTLLMPAIALLLGTLVLDEPLAARQLGGLALIAAGLAAIDGRLMTMVRPRTARPVPP